MHDENFKNIEKIKYLFYLLSINGFTDFYQIDFVNKNEVYLSYRRDLKDEIRSIYQIAYDKEAGSDLEMVTLTEYKDINELVRLMCESKFILINIESLLIEIVNGEVKIRNIHCCCF